MKWTGAANGKDILKNLKRCQTQQQHILLCKITNQRILTMKKKPDCNHEYLEPCFPCPLCGYEYHVFRDEPYCEECGKPHEAYHAAVRIAAWAAKQLVNEHNESKDATNDNQTNRRKISHM